MFAWMRRLRVWSAAKNAEAMPSYAEAVDMAISILASAGNGAKASYAAACRSGRHADADREFERTREPPGLLRIKRDQVQFWLMYLTLKAIRFCLGLVFCDKWG